jgi:hypothetical protein
MSSTGNKDNVAINLKDSSASYPPSSKLFCNRCSRNLVLLDATKEEWYCNACGIIYFPNRGDGVRKANKFSTPADNRDKIPPFAMVDDSNANVRPKKSIFPKSLEMLKRPGVNITDFSSSVDNEGI